MRLDKRDGCTTRTDYQILPFYTQDAPRLEDCEDGGIRVGLYQGPRGDRQTVRSAGVDNDQRSLRECGNHIVGGKQLQVVALRSCLLH